MSVAYIIRISNSTIRNTKAKSNEGPFLAPLISFYAVLPFNRYNLWHKVRCRAEPVVEHLSYWQNCRLSARQHQADQSEQH